MDWGSDMTEHKNIYLALCAAQAGMGKVVKGATNPAFRSKYADLGDVVSVAVPALNEQGVAMFHYMLRDEHGAVMRTTLVHGASGTEISCDVPLIINKNDMQGMKSATTYAKRIGLESLTGIAPEDDDGNAAAKAAPKAEAIRLIGAEQFQEINELIFETETDELKFCTYWKVTMLEDLTDKQGIDAIAMLKKKAAQAGVASGTAQ
jgi:hypothetical protein